MRRRASFLLAATLAVGAFGACGDDDDDTAASGTEDEFAATTSSTVPSEGATTSSTGGGATTSSTGGGEEEPAFDEGDADAVLEYSLIEYEFNGPLDAEAGKLFFKAKNDGKEDHELEILDSNGEALGEIEAMPAGAEGSFAIELAAGTYTFQCILENANGKSHKDLGMVSEFTVK